MLDCVENEVFGNLYKRKSRAIKRLEGPQLYLQDHPNSFFHLTLEDTLQLEILHIMDQEELFWLSKSLNWCMQGDRNIAFFHKGVQIKRNKGMIHSLQNGSGIFLGH